MKTGHGWVKMICLVKIRANYIINFMVLENNEEYVAFGFNKEYAKNLWENKVISKYQIQYLYMKNRKV